jgi:hypothetical protein
MSVPAICGAIASRNLIRFNYTSDLAPGYRVVEPHMIAYNEANHLSLSGWFLEGASESNTGQGWREYLLESVFEVTVLPQQFSRARPGYKPDGGKKFHNVQCAL